LRHSNRLWLLPSGPVWKTIFSADSFLAATNRPPPPPRSTAGDTEVVFPAEPARPGDVKLVAEIAAEVAVEVVAVFREVEEAEEDTVGGVTCFLYRANMARKRVMRRRGT
jgi:hypothetical protein